MICPKCERRTIVYQIKRELPVPKGVNIKTPACVVECMGCGWAEVKSEIVTLDAVNHFFSVPRQGKKKVMVRRKPVAKKAVAKRQGKKKVMVRRKPVAKKLASKKVG
jgi:hypothetical protein